MRTSKTASGDTTEYVLDLAATLPVVIADTEAVYLYGLDIIAQQQSETLYYVHDGLGSVRQLLDSTGEIQTNYAYDPFGVPLVGGDVSNPYQFTGEAWDEEVGLLYLRARYYQPEVGRFITKDPWVGDVWRPSTLDPYLYVANDPINSVDPAGLRGEEPPPVAIWTTREMVRNVQGGTLKTILLLNKMSRNSVGIAATSSKLSALTLFGWMVRQRGPWDPKKYIEEQSDPHYSHPIGQYWYYYDIWGNIMFGYLGVAAEFSESELLNGAGLEQIGSDIGYCLGNAPKGGPCTLPYPRGGWCSALRLWTWDHPEDRVTSQIGIRLWRQHGMNIQAQHLVDAIVDAGDRGEITRKLEPWGGEKGPMQWQW